MVAILRTLNAETGLTILLIEHVMRAVMALAQEIFVLHHGEVLAHGTPEQISRNPAVLECYLGEDTEL
jgi:branched-chain amino acid transport system ATP-binding protein